MLHKSFGKEIGNGHYERTEQGIYLEKSKVLLCGHYTHEVRRQREIISSVTDHNLVTNEGLDHIISTVLKGGAQTSTWYIGLFKGNYTPAAGDTAANIVANSTEAQTEYDESARPALTLGAVTSQSVDNSASKAIFTLNATVTIYGAFLISVSTKGSTTGTLLSASRFAAKRDLVATDQLLVTYTFAAQDAV
jgi:hypothetical protein